MAAVTNFHELSDYFLARVYFQGLFSCCARGQKSDVSLMVCRGLRSSGGSGEEPVSCLSSSKCS